MGEENDFLHKKTKKDLASLVRLVIWILGVGVVGDKLGITYPESERLARGISIENEY